MRFYPRERVQDLPTRVFERDRLAVRSARVPESGEGTAGLRDTAEFRPEGRVESDAGPVPVRGGVLRDRNPVGRVGDDRVEGRIGYLAEGDVNVGVDEFEGDQRDSPGFGGAVSGQFTEPAVSAGLG